MTQGLSRLRRFKEWFWRGQLLRQLRQREWSGQSGQTLAEAQSCYTLAWRALAGVEPIPAATQDAVARPLVLEGIATCLPLLEPRPAALAELFDDQVWQERLASAGVGVELQPAIRNWLLDIADDSKARVSGHDALLVLRALLETLDAARAAVRSVLWRRVAMLGAVVALLSSLAVGIALIVSPPEGPDLGVGKTWQTSSTYPGFAGAGTKQKNPSEGAFFSTGEDSNPWWSLDLRAPTRIGGATVVNRSDCCPDRAIPLALELSTDGQTWREVARRTEPFRTWSPSFAATNARFVRLRALRRTYLHLKDVRIHAPRGK
jgi:hypothetical protein